MIRTSIPLLLPVQELRSVLVTDIIRYSTVIVSNANQKDNYSALYMLTISYKILYLGYVRKKCDMLFIKDEGCLTF